MLMMLLKDIRAGGGGVNSEQSTGKLVYQYSIFPLPNKIKEIHE